MENLQDMSTEEVILSFAATREQIDAILEFVAQSLRVSTPEPPSVPEDTPSRSVQDAD